MTFKPAFYESMGKTQAAVALDMWQLGELIQANHGKWTREILVEKVPELDYLLDAKMLLSDFIFINRDGLIFCIRHWGWNDLDKSEQRLIGKYEPFDMNHIWASGKKDERWRWVRTWLLLFSRCMDTEINKKYNALLQEWRDYYKPPARPDPVRPHTADWLEHHETVRVAHMWQLSLLMQRWMYKLSLGAGIRFKIDIHHWMSNVWMGQAELMKMELEYRTEAKPKERSSKKKTEAARRDFRKAALYLSGAENVYSDDFINMMVQAAFPFDPNADYEQLPKMPPAQAPVMHMDKEQLMNEFIRWVTEKEIDPDSFEAEDAQLLRNRLREALEDTRKSFARAKGQSVQTQSINGDESE